MLKLVKLTEQYKSQLIEMLDEWTAKEDDITPMSIVRNDYHDFSSYLENLEVKNADSGLVPDSTFFCLDTDRDIFVGAVNIRHYLNDYLLQIGGHIGDGVRPSERNKGYGTKMLALSLDECKKLGIDRVLIVCEKDNIPSAKCIVKNGFTLENEVVDDGVVCQRYWINI